MGKTTESQVIRVRAAALGDRQQVVDLEQMGRVAAAPGERIAIHAASFVVARCSAGQPRECGAVGIGGGCGQSRGLCAPLLRLMRRAVRLRVTRRVPAPAREWRPARPARRRRHGSHPLSRGPRTAAPQQRRARPMERHLLGRRLPVQRVLKVAISDTIDRALDCLEDAHSRGAWLSPKEAAPVLEERLRKEVISVLTQFVARTMPDRLLRGVTFQPAGMPGGGGTLYVHLDEEVTVPMLMGAGELATGTWADG